MSGTGPHNLPNQLEFLEIGTMHKITKNPIFSHVGVASNDNIRSPEPPGIASLKPNSAISSTKNHARNQTQEHPSTNASTTENSICMSTDVAGMSDESFKRMRQSIADSKVITSAGVHEIARRYLKERREIQASHKNNSSANCVAEITRAGSDSERHHESSSDSSFGAAGMLGDKFLQGLATFASEEYSSSTYSTATADTYKMHSNSSSSEALPQYSSSTNLHQLDSQNLVGPSGTKINSDPASATSTPSKKGRRPLKRLSKDAQDMVASFFDDLQRENSDGFLLDNSPPSTHVATWNNSSEPDGRIFSNTKAVFLRGLRGEEECTSLPI